MFELRGDVGYAIVATARARRSVPIAPAIIVLVTEKSIRDQLWRAADLDGSQ